MNWSFARPTTVQVRVGHSAVDREPGQLLAQASQARDLCVGLGDVAAHERLGVPAGTRVMVTRGQQLGDLTPSQPEPLGALDEVQPLG